jgi:uncharacterized protein (DUF2147 family)
MIALGQTIEKQAFIVGNSGSAVMFGVMVFLSICLILLVRSARKLTGTRLFWSVTLAAGLAAGSASASPSPIGAWTTASGHGVIAIAQCGDALCGRIVGIDRQPTDPMPVDVNGRPQCGLTIITGEKPEAGGTWLGEITDPRDGSSYHAKLWVDDAGNLRLRGFIGIPALGATQIWHPFAGHLTAACGLA